MRLDYGTQLSQEPIKLSIGTIHKPRLMDIANLSFETFDIFQMFLKLSPALFYEKLNGAEGKQFWKSLSDEQKESITLFDLIVNNDALQKTYQEIFNFFFEETVIYSEGLFFLFKKSENEETSQDDIIGIIHAENFDEVLNLLQQICCIADEDDIDEKSIKFKNAAAKRIFDKLKKAKKAEKEQKKRDINLSLPNVISAVSNKHPTISPISVWGLTVFQLLDAFSRLQINTMFDIDCTRVSVWGDEKKAFKAEMWFKNNFDKEKE